VLIAIVVWGSAIAVFGVLRWLPAALLLLVVAGGADVISAVFRGTIVQMETPDRLRGRLSALNSAVVQGGPRLGNAEAGAVAAVVGTTASVVSGGVACLIGTAILWKLMPDFAEYRLLSPASEAR
jgi:hypothetical protein